MLLIDRLFGKRDLLIPYFDFSKVLRGNRESLLLQDIYRLRYQVYCLECGFLPPDAAQGLETDDYDACAIHVAAYTLDQALAGTVRLVQPREGQPYPFESHCQLFDHVAPPPRAQAAEVSRLVVRKTFRRRRGDSLQGISQHFAEQGSPAAIGPARPARQGEQRGNSPLLLLGMYREMYRHSRANGVRYWYAAMERSLARSLDRMGFSFVPLGPQADYYGRVTPHMVDLDQLDARLRRENSFLAAWFNDERIPLWTMFKTLARPRLR